MSRAWTDHEDRVLRHLYEHQTNVEIGQALERSPSAVQQRAKKLGLRKQQNAGRFKKGQSPWNKGKSYRSGGRSAETRFKPGRPAHESHNYRPVGSLRLSKDGYLERKVTDDPGTCPARRWVAVHRLVWEAEHGPIPAGHIVVFKPGCKTTEEHEITMDRLDCITRRENMERNTAQRFGPEVFRLIQLRGALNRKIRRIEREQHEKQD